MQTLLPNLAMLCRRSVTGSVMLLLLVVSAACVALTGRRTSGRTHPAGDIYARLPMSGTPFAVAVAPDGVVYVTLLHRASIARTDLTGEAIKDEIPVGLIPSQVRAGGSRTVYVGNQNTPSVGVVDADAGRQVRSIALTRSVLTMGLSPDGAHIYALTDDAGVQVFDARSGRVLALIPAGPTLTGIAFDPTAPRVYVTARDGGRVTAIDTRLREAVATYATGGSPQNVAVSPDGTELYVTDIATSALQIWDLRTGRRTAAVTVGSRMQRNAFDVAVTPDGTQLWVSTLADGKVFVLDRVTRSVARIIPTGGSPRYIAFDATGSRAVIANESGWVTFVR